MTIIFYCFSRRIAEKMQREANILANLRHGNIVPCVGILWSPNLYALAMGLAEYGSLQKFAEDHNISHKVKVSVHNGGLPFRNVKIVVLLCKTKKRY